MHHGRHELCMHGEEIAFTERPKIHSKSQIFMYCRSIFCLPHLPKFSDNFVRCPLMANIDCKSWKVIRVEIINNFLCTGLTNLINKSSHSRPENNTLTINNLMFVLGLWDSSGREMNFSLIFFKITIVTVFFLKQILIIKSSRWINLGARFTKFLSKYELYKDFLIDPIAITCWINLGARFTKFLAKHELYKDF